MVTAAIARIAAAVHNTQIIRLTHFVSARAFCFGRRVCRLLSVCLSRIRSRKLRKIRAKFRHPYKKSGPESKNMTSDFALETCS